jgi:prophage regulatory protein
LGRKSVNVVLKMFIQPTQLMPDAASIQPFDPSLIIIRIPEVEKITSLKRPTIYKRLKDDPTFPKPVPLSDSTARGAPVGFVLAEVQQWVRSRIATRTKVKCLPLQGGSPLHGRDELASRETLAAQGVASSAGGVTQFEKSEVVQ